MTHRAHFPPSWSIQASPFTHPLLQVDNLCTLLTPHDYDELTPHALGEMTSALADVPAATRLSTQGGTRLPRHRWTGHKRGTRVQGAQHRAFSGFQCVKVARICSSVHLEVHLSPLGDIGTLVDCTLVDCTLANCVLPSTISPGHSTLVASATPSMHAGHMQQPNLQRQLRMRSTGALLRPLAAMCGTLFFQSAEGTVAQVA